MSDETASEITLSPFYYSAVNEVTKPNSLVFVSHYFADRWMRELGPLGTAIVVCLRSRCYHNAKTGEKRDRVQVAVPEIAAEIGVSAKTVRREMDGNKVLPKFLRRQREWAPGPTAGSLRKDAYTYQVAMDDPVHPLDEGRLTEIVREKARLAEKGESEEEAKERARRRGTPTGSPSQRPSGQNDRTESQSPPGQNDHTAPGVDNLTTSRDRMTTPRDKMTRGTGQNDQTLKESYSLLENPLNPSARTGPGADTTAKFSFSLFSEREETPPPTPQPRPWTDLSDEEKRPYAEQAASELRRYALEAGAERWARIGPRQEAVRAKNIYEAAVKGKPWPGRPA